MVVLTVFLLRTKLANSATPTTAPTTPSTAAETATAVGTTELCRSEDEEEEEERESLLDSGASAAERADLFSVKEEGKHHIN